VGKRRTATLRFPTGGLLKRMALQDQAPYTSPDLSNVWPDTATNERERGGSRPGLGKSHSTQLGSGNPIRLLTTLMYQDTSNVGQTKLVASSNGSLYVEASSSTLSAVSSNLTLISDRSIQSAVRNGILYIADDGARLAKATDGAISSNVLTSATVGNFASASVNQYDHMVVITAHGTTNEIQTITISGSPTGGTWRARFGSYTTDPLAYDISSANLQVALRALASIDGAHVTVSGSAGGPYTVTFVSDLAAQDVEMIEVDGLDLTGGTNPDVAVVETTAGVASTDYAGTYAITSVVTTSLTITDTLPNMSSVTFHIQRGAKKYTGSSGTLALWNTSTYSDGTKKGFIPVGCPLLCLWRDRLVLAGGKYDPHLWFMSRQGDPLDFDYGADPEDPGRAISGQVSQAGELGEPITALIPHNSLCLVIGCATSLWIMRGDPAFGGQIDRLNAKIGIISANAWCYSPEEYLFFLSHDGLYMMSPGCGGNPVSVSRERLPKELIGIDTTSYTVSMAYDVRYRGIHIFVSKNSAGTTSHYFVDNKLTKYGDAPTGVAFFPTALASTNYEPFVMHSRRNYVSDYSDVILGCRDGYLRRFQHNLYQDDSTEFDSYVTYGPMRAASSDYTDGRLDDVTVSLSGASGDVTLDARVGETFEDAYDATACESATFYSVGLQYPMTVRRRCRAYCLKFSGAGTNEQWAIESVNVTLSDVGRQRKQ
jgi:hypothetical protein